MKTYPGEEFDKNLKDFFSHRQEVPAHVKSQIHARLLTHEDAKNSRLHNESNFWAGMMVLCSVMCMVALALTGWMFFGQTVLWIMGGIYYLLTMGGMAVMLLSNREPPKTPFRL